jgi:uncharacterized protein (TIGR00290 family)
MEKAALFWSGGKDSAYALYLSKDILDIKYLVTTFSDSSQRVTMHGLSPDLVRAQVAATGIALKEMWLTDPTNKGYEVALLDIFKELKSEGITTIIFGDIFLEDLKAYRNNLLKKAGLKGYYPLWKKDTTELLKEMNKEGFDTLVCCADTRFIAKEDIGKSLWNIDTGIADPCGENGEFHTFCFQGPIYKEPLRFRKGDLLMKELKGVDEMVTYGFIDLIKQ